MLSSIAIAAVLSLQSDALAQGNAKGPRIEAPHLTEIIPAHGSVHDAHLPVTLHGTGFMPTGNIVEFGPAQIAGLPSATGNAITFAVPKSLPSRGEIPPPVLPPGEYGMRVTTPGP